MWFKERKYAWFLLAFLWVFGFIGSLGRYVFAYYQPQITDILHVGRTFLGFSFSTSVFISAFSAPFGGWLTDKFGYKKVMIFSSILGVISTSIILTFPNPTGYFIGFGLISGLVGIGASTSYVLVANWFKYHRALALMIVSSAGSLGLAVLTPVFVSNKSWLNWIVAYRFIFIIGCAFIVLSMLIIRLNKNADQKELPHTVGNPKKKIKIDLSYFKNPTLLVVMLALFTCGFSMGTVETHLMAIHQTAHVNDAMFSSALSTLGLLEVVGGVLFSLLLDRTSKVLALSTLYFIRVAAFIFLFFHFEWSPILFSLLFGASYLGAIPGGILVAGEALKNKKSMGLQTGLLILIHQIGGSISAISGGMDFDLFHNYQLLIFVNLMLSLAAAAGYFSIFIVSKQKTLRDLHQAF
ncbi:MAG: major facilitator superfamily 1 [Bacilli bacterium]|nr:major facilitator superfamily 1 [Bacilli bacterium]